MSETDSEEVRPIADLTKQVARPLLWHDVREPWPKKLTGASCFTLGFEDGLVGVTANHVIAALESAQAQSERIVCLLRTAVLDLPAVLIDRSEVLDIATFEVTEQQLAESEAVAIDCGAGWPPPSPERDDALSVGGYPDALKVAAPRERYTFHGYVHMGRVEDVSERNLVAVYAPERGDRRMRAAPGFPDIGGNFSGCSGGPVLLHIERGGLHRWFPAGLVVGGPGQTSAGGFAGLDVFHFRRIHFIGKDGSIREPISALFA